MIRQHCKTKDILFSREPFLSLKRNTFLIGFFISAIGIVIDGGAVGPTRIAAGTVGDTTNGPSAVNPGGIGIGGGDNATTAYGANAAGNNSIAIGTGVAPSTLGATANGNSSVSIGTQSTANAVYDVAMGFGASTAGGGGTGNATALGTQTLANGTAAAAVGYSAQATGNNSSAFGSSSVASGAGSVAIGNGATASNFSSTAIGNGSQATGYGGIAIGLNYYNNTTASGNDTIAIGGDANASGDTAMAFGRDSISSGTGSVAMGPGSTASGYRAVTLGQGAQATGNNAIAIGGGVNGQPNYTQATSNQGVAMGQYARVNYVAAGGATPTGTADWGMALGGNAYTSAYSGVSIGPNARTSADYGIALGYNSQSTALYSTSVGYNSSATAQGAVALGQGSQASTAYTVSVGSGQSGDSATYQYRRIVNVATPQNPNDAATKGYVDNAITGIATNSTAIDSLNSQVADVNRRVDYVGAMQMSLANAQPTIPDGKSTAVGIGVGTYHGQTATSAGLVHRLPGNFQVSGNFTLGNGGEKAGGLGLGYVF